MISIIIPAYNEEKVIGDCLKSLKLQSYKDIEIIIVDDGSTDATAKLAGNLQLLKQQHKGPGAARNLGASKAKGEILVFVDADMTFDKDFIKKLVAPIEKGKVRGTFSKEEYVSNWENIWARCWNINEGWEEKRRHPKNYPDKQKVFRAILKSEFDKAGGFDSSHGYIDDWSLSEKLGYEAVAVSGAKFYHRNPDSLREVFNQAKWIGKRHYKFGLIGDLYALLRASFPVSLIVGLLSAINNQLLAFLIFKVIYDFGVFVGILDFLITGKRIK
jgi:glycosyltransferase involved in cell wall biosynthesis